MDTSPLPLDIPGLTPESAATLPEGIRRQVARFWLRWRSAGSDTAAALPLLPARDYSPRDRFDRCRALIASGDVEGARNLARDLVNAPDAGHWGHRAVGEVFLAMERPDRADERFRAASDPVGRARAWLLLQNPRNALEMLRQAFPDDPEAEAVRCEALRRLGDDTSEVEARLRALLEEERRELLETLGMDPGQEGASFLTAGGPPPTDAEGLRAALHRLFQYDDFRPGQLEVILPLMAGQSVLGTLPTGAGKSVCFQLPAALLPGATVVISPLIALMKDQVDGLPPALYRRATLINSALEPGEADRRLEAVARGDVSLVYAAPERLRHRSFVRALQRRGVSLFVIDEAHCVSLWGHDFRPDYFFIRDVLRDLGQPTVLALTATATPDMREDIGRQLGVRLHPVDGGVFRPNLHLAARKLSGEGDKWMALLEALQGEKGPAIVYVDRRKLAEDISQKLRDAGIPAEPYHAGLARDVREAVQNRFMLGEARVIAATVAFGMGVDKADVRTVVHYNLPRSLEAYYQEAGRAGRDGLPARCLLLYTSNDKSNLTRRTNSDRLQAPEILTLYRKLDQRLKRQPGPLALEELERDCASESTRLRVGISLLQRIGALERGYDLPTTVWVAGLSPSPGSGGSDDRFRQFATALGLTSRGVSLPAERAAAAAGLARDALEPALLDWQEAGWVRYRPGARGMGLRTTAGAASLEREVRDVLQQMEKLDAERLKRLTAYLDSAECRQTFVSRYFGETLPQGCGVCDNCRRAADRSLKAAEPGAAASSRAAAGPLVFESDEESALYELLRAWRRKKAQEEGMPAYIIFHDRVLYQIAHMRPMSLEALAGVPGVGRTKIQTFGQEVIEIVRQAR